VPYTEMHAALSRMQAGSSTARHIDVRPRDDQEVLVSEIQIGRHRRLSVHSKPGGEHSASCCLRLETTGADGRVRRFDMWCPLQHLPALIDVLVEVEQAAIDDGLLPEWDDDADGGAA
jgi:hypothetical protein